MTGHRRGDVQGLRGIAVLLVIATHAVGIPRGGFAGVDIFFVISGFVITAGLIREAERDGTVSLARFYLRRLRRLVPAAFVTLTVSLAAALLLLPAARLAAVFQSVAWSAVGAGNWWLIAAGETHDFAATSVSPVGHFWSLGVEEQFYLVWPVLLLAGWRVGVRRGAPRRWLAAAAGTASLLSLGLAVWGSVTDAGVAYFSSVDRGWELGVGCLVAVAVPWLQRLTRGPRVMLAFAGLIGVGAGCVVWGQEAFPLPGALLPVAGAALLIAAGTGEDVDVAITSTLGRPVLRRVGDLSYSLYLWHFPVFVFMVVLQPRAGIDVLGEALVVTVLLSWLSYRFVEQPFLRRSTSGTVPLSSWSSPTPTQPTGLPASPPTPTRSTL